MDQFSKQKSIEIARGLFLVKYEAAENQQDAPKFLISVDPATADCVELIVSPGTDNAILWSPGACVVALATRAGRIRVAVAPGRPGGSTAGRIQLVNLSNDPAGLQQEGGSFRKLDLSGFRVVGHLAGVGDTLADCETWIAGPTSPSRIEGIAIQWPGKPDDFSLRYAVTVGGARPAMGQFVAAGQYAGTRGRALPIVGATLEISGRAAAGHQLAVDVIFLGSPQMRVTGQRVVLTGPTGREPLVGLRLGVEPAGGVQGRGKLSMRSGDFPIRPRPGQPVESPVNRGKEQRRRVRVFRSETSRRQGVPTPSEER